MYYVGDTVSLLNSGVLPPETELVIWYNPFIV
jgi:hypothetical protein